MKALKRYLLISIVIIFMCNFLSFAESRNTPFSLGEKLRYGIYAAGLRVGSQTIELQSVQKLNGTDVYLLKGLSRTSPFVSIFYRLNDDWSIFIDKNTLLPLRVEKDWKEGPDEGYYTYDIDQANDTVIHHNVIKGNTKTLNSENDVFDLFSLIYFYRYNPHLFDTTYTFDFLEIKSVRTVHFQNEGEVELAIPKISRKKDITITAYKLKQVGGIGIEIYIANDNLRLPLKMVVPSKLPKGKKLNVEFYIDKFSPGSDQKDIPYIYKLLRY